MNPMQLNPQVFAAKKYLFDVLKERYEKNEDVIERLAAALVTQKDLQAFGQLVLDIYETGYLKSLNEQKEILQRAGVKVNVVAERKETAPPPQTIFKK